MRITLWVLAALVACAAAADEKVIVCYFGSWAIYRKGNGNINIETDIDPTLCTHLIYTFVGITGEGNITILDAWADLPDGGGKNGYAKFNNLTSRNPDLKTMIAIGGWNEGSVKYSTVVSNAKARANFVVNAVQFVKQYGFHGMDFDWEYPTQRGGLPSDKENFVLLLKELREAFDKEGFLLTVAVGANIKLARESYDVAGISKYVHFIHLMGYDFHIPGDNVTGMNAPLLPGPWEKGENRTFNVRDAVKYWLSQGAAPEKLVLGMPLYGHAYTLTNPEDISIGAPATAGKAGPYSGQAGVLLYNEICELQFTEIWNIRWESNQRVPYAIKDTDQWITYDNPRSLTEKTNLVKKYKLAGAMVWSVEGDDFKGIDGEKNPLLKTLNRNLRSSVNV